MTTAIRLLRDQTDADCRSTLLHILFTNQGTAEAFGGFQVRLFEDRNGNRAFDLGTDLLLGDSLQSVLPPGESLTILVDLPEATTLSFRDSILTVIVDYTGIYKADVGIKAGTIVGIGKAGNPDVMAGVSPGSGPERPVTGSVE